MEFWNYSVQTPVWNDWKLQPQSGFFPVNPLVNTLGGAKVWKNYLLNGKGYWLGLNFI